MNSNETYETVQWNYELVKLKSTSLKSFILLCFMKFKKFKNYKFSITFGSRFVHLFIRL